MSRKKKPTPFSIQLKKWYPRMEDRSSIIHKFISIHIPRTGGTTFRNLLFYWYGILNVLHDETSKRYIPDIIKASPPPNATLFDIIHGHFHHTKYDYLGLPMVTWVRNPIDMVASQFYSLKIHNTTARSPEIHIKIIKEEMTLIDFARYEGTRNPISKFIGGTDLDKFDFIGITEYYDESLQRFGKWSGMPIPNAYPIYNFRDYPEISKKERDIIGKYNKKDLIIYDEAVKRFAP